MTHPGQYEPCDEAERLTAFEMRVLASVSDWKAVFEVVENIYNGAGVATGVRSNRRRAVENSLIRLRDKYLVQYSAQNSTYRITDAGRKVRQFQGSIT